MFNLKNLLLILVLFVLALLSFTPIFGQTTTATLSGTVTDENGAVIAGATVKVSNTATGFERTVATDENGSFTIPLLPPSTYVVNIERTGFALFEARDVTLNVGDQKALNVQLKVGTVSGGTVDVTSEPPLVNTSPAVSTTVDRQFVGNLPLNGRSFQSLILLTPGVVGVPSNHTNPGEFSVNGQRQNANYFTVDGVSANTGSASVIGGGAFSQQAGGAIPGTTALGTTASLVSVDALEEFKIQTSTYSAEYGRQPGGQVQLVTRSGGNQFHLTAFDYVRNDKFDARNYFNRKPALKPPLRQNQFGGTFSGPVILPQFGEGRPFWWKGKDKTFFFFSYEGQRLLLPQVIATTNKVPSLGIRQSAAAVLKPFLNAYPQPTGPEIQVAQNQSLPLQPDPTKPNYNPLVPSGTAPFVAAYSNPSSVDAYSIRLDHTVNSKISLFGRYASTPSHSLTRTMNRLVGTVYDNRTLTVGSTFLTTRNLNNEFRFNYTKNKGSGSYSMDNFGGAVPITVDQMLAAYSSEASGPIQTCFSFASSYCLGDYADNYQRQLNLVDNISWTKVAHQFKFGIDWRHLTPFFGPPASNLQSVINIGYFDTSQIDLANGGRVSYSFIQASRPAHLIFDNVSAYAQDTWKVSPRLTIDFGLRWEVNPAPHDADGVTPVLITGVTGTDVSKATLAQAGSPIYKTTYTAFAPRVGVAYQLDQKAGRETIVRGGFGVYYDLGNNMATQGFDGYPFNASKFLDFPTLPLTQAQATPPGFDSITIPVPPYTDLWAINPDLKLPYTLEWNVALQQSLGKQQTVTLSYVASAARRLTVQSSLNSVPGTAIIVDSSDEKLYRPNHNFSGIRFIRNAGTSDYQSLQAQYQRRLSRGLQALVNYTWSHAIDEVSTDTDGENPLVRGNADFDVRHNFSAAVTYDLPKLSGSGPIGHLVRGIANGWSLDSVFYARTGTPLSVAAAGDTLADGRQVTIYPDIVPGVPVWIKDPSVPGGQRLNTNAFAYPPYTVIHPYPFDCPDCTQNVYQRQGTLGRNNVRLPGIYQINMAVRRQFNLGERLKLQLKAEAFNVLNHPLFSAYGSFWYPTNTTFGVPSSTLSSGLSGRFGSSLSSLYELGGPRSMQFSLRLSF